MYKVYCSNYYDCRYYYKFSSGDYTVLYNILYTYDLFSVYKNTSVFVADISLNAVFPDAMEQAICQYAMVSLKSQNCTTSILATIWVEIVLKFFLESQTLSHINVDCLCKNCPSVIQMSAADVCRDNDIFSKQFPLLNYILAVVLLTY